MLWTGLSFYKATRKVLEAPRSKSYVCRPTLQQKADLDALPNPAFRSSMLDGSYSACSVLHRPTGFCWENHGRC